MLKTILKACMTASLLGGVALGASVLSAQAETKVKIGWTTSDGEKDPYAIAARSLEKEVEKALPNTFSFSQFPNAQLGDEKQMLEGLNFGTLDIAIITNAVIANIEPAFQLNDMPFLYGSNEQAHKVLDGDVGADLLSRLAAKGIVGLGFAEGGFRHMINNSRPVSAPADVSGVKYRVMQNPVFINMFKALGGNAVPMAWGETYTATQQGTIDGLEIPLAVISSNKYADVTKYLSLTRHTYSALGVLVSKRFYNKLSSEQQDGLKKAAKAAIAAQRATVAANAGSLVESLKKAGMEVNEVSDAGAFRARVGTVYDMFKPKIGADLFDKALAQVK